MLSVILPVLLLDAAAGMPAASVQEEWERLTARSFELLRHGRYDDAIHVSREALEATREAFGPRHPNVARSMNNLGAMMSKHGDIAEAEVLLTGALDILEESLGRNHPGTASTLNNLAGLYSDRGRFEEAEPLYLSALSIRREGPGKDNSDLLTTLDNLAVLYIRMDRFREAEPLCHEALKLRTETLGKGHPDVDSSMEDIQRLYIREGNLHKTLGRNNDAAAAYRKALDIMENRPHPELSETASLLETLAVLYIRAGSLDEAVHIYYRLCSLNMQLHGAQSLEYARSVRDLADTYMRMKKYPASVPLYGEAIKVQREILENDDPEILRSRRGYTSAMISRANEHLESGRTAEAVPLLTLAIEIMMEYDLGAKEALAVRMNNLAGLLVGLERYEEAEQQYSRSFDILKKARGDGHADLITVLENMKHLHELTGDIDKEARADSLLTVISGKP